MRRFAAVSASSECEQLLLDADEEEEARSSSLRRHPPGLWVLACCEAFERFSYYVSRSVLTLYARDVAFASSRRSSDDRDALAAKLYGQYTAFVYLTPVFGGYFADTASSPHATMSSGLALMAIGNACVASRAELLFIGLTLVALGNGGFKPNVSNRLSEMYRSPKDEDDEEDDEDARSRKDSAFGIFYGAINVGALIAPLVAGVLTTARGNDARGYRDCFGAAAVGLVAASGVYGAFRKKYVYRAAAFDGEDKSEGEERDEEGEGRGGGGEEEGRGGGGKEEGEGRGGREEEEEEEDERDDDDDDGVNDDDDVDARRPKLADVLRKHRLRLSALFIVALTTVGFWAAYEQAGNALSLFIDERVTRNGIPTAAFQSINPGLILVFTPLINWHWRAQSANNKEPDQVTKMAMGCAMLGIANVVLAFASMHLSVSSEDPNCEEKISQFWIWLYFLVATAGELYVSPVGLSFVTSVAPEEIAGLALGCWFLSSFFGNYIAGEIGSFYARTSPFLFWNLVGGLSCFVGALLFALRSRIVKALEDKGRVDSGEPRIAEEEECC